MAPLILFALGSLLAGHAYASPPKVVSMPVRHSKRNITLDINKRDPFAIAVQNLLDGHQYFVTAQVGTPPQNVDLVVDTGSSDTWMFGTGACHASQAGPCIGGEFDTSASSTYKNLEPKLGEFKNEYGDGSKVQGPFFSDDFTIGGESVNALTMGLASKASGIIRSGIMGIGYDRNEGRIQFGLKPYPDLPDVLLAQGLISSKSFSVYLDDIAEATGSVLFGGYDPAKFYGDMTMLPIQNDPLTGGKIAFFVSLTDLGLSTGKETFSFSSPHHPYPIPVLLDTGTEDITIPFELFSPFVEAFKLKPLEAGTEGLFAPFEADCKIPNKALGTSAVFSFGSVKGGTIIKVPIEELIVPFYNPVSGKQVKIGGQPLCRFGIVAAPPGSPIVLGQTFLRSAYVLYDLENGAVGLAQAKYDQESSDVKEYSGSGNNPGISTDTAEPTASTVNYLAPSYVRDLLKVTPSIAKINTAFTVTYPHTAPPGSVAATPSAVTGKVSDSGSGTSNSGGQSGGQSTKTGDASRLSVFTDTGPVMLTASLILSLGGVVCML